MAEDEGFGDFKFVTAFDPNSNSTHQRQSAVSDDDWGDFVTDATTSQIKTHVVLSNGFAHSQWPPPAQVPADPFGFFNIANGSAAPPTSTGSDPIRVETKPENVSKTQWEKPRGALPLSLFGEEEKDEQPTVNHDATELTKSEGFEKKGSNLNDLISNFYVQNGSNPNSGSGGPNSGLNLSSNGKLDGMNLNFSGSDLKFEGIDSNSNSNSSALKLNLEEGNGDFDDDDDAWEFKAAESDHRVSNESSKVMELLSLLIRIAETNCLCFCLFILFYYYCWQEKGVVEVAELKVESNTLVHHRGIQAGIVYCCMTCLLIVLWEKKNLENQNQFTIVITLC